jgi:FkbM family methyltransferase
VSEGLSMRADTVRQQMPAQGQHDPASLREAQAASFIADDLARYFEISEQLAAASPGYGRSYEYWTHTVFHALARCQRDPFLLQVGAMDGKRFDPIYAFVKHYGWPGLILEPLPDLFARLSANYAGQANVTLVNAALTDTDGERGMLRVNANAVDNGSVPLWAEGLGTFFPERNALGGVGLAPGDHATLRAHSSEERVACLTLRSLIERWPTPRIDLLQVDAEGCELDILRQVDQAGFLPRVVHMEHWALPPRERGELLGLLGERGYLLRMSESDVMAIDPALRQTIQEEADWPC